MCWPKCAVLNSYCWTNKSNIGDTLHEFGVQYEKAKPEISIIYWKRIASVVNLQFWQDQTGFCNTLCF